MTRVVALQVTKVNIASGAVPPAWFELLIDHWADRPLMVHPAGGIRLLEKSCQINVCPNRIRPEHNISEIIKILLLIIPCFKDDFLIKQKYTIKSEREN